MPESQELHRLMTREGHVPVVDMRPRDISYKPSEAMIQWVRLWMIENPSTGWRGVNFQKKCRARTRVMFEKISEALGAAGWFARGDHSVVIFDDDKEQEIARLTLEDDRSWTLRVKPETEPKLPDIFEAIS